MHSSIGFDTQKPLEYSVDEPQKFVLPFATPAYREALLINAAYRCRGDKKQINILLNYFYDLT